MGIIKWAHSSWEQRVPIHTAFNLLCVFGIAALLHHDPCRSGTGEGATSKSAGATA
jgi:hypothetical protein